MAYEESQKYKEGKFILEKVGRGQLNEASHSVIATLFCPACPGGLCHAVPCRAVRCCSDMLRIDLYVPDCSAAMPLVVRLRVQAKVQKEGSW